MNKAQPVDQSRETEEQAVSGAESDEERETAGGNPPTAGEEASEAPQAEEEQAVQPPLPYVLPNAAERRALLEAIVYVTEEPVTTEQLAQGLGIPADVIQADLEQLAEETRSPGRGVEIRGVAGGYKMFTKAEHHEMVRQFVRTLRPKLRLSLPALETLAVVAYKQPVTVPEIQAIRGVNAGGVIHTLLNHKLITTAGRKKVIGRPMQYKTTKEFLVQFGLNDLSELPDLKELEELSRAALGEGEEPEQPGGQAAEGDSVSGTGSSTQGADAAEEVGAEAAESSSGGNPDSSEDPAGASANPPAMAAAAGASRVVSPTQNKDANDDSET